MYIDEDDNEVDIVYNAESYNKIKLKLKEIKIAFNFHDIDCKFSERRIKLQSISLEQAENRLAIWKNISKLSVYLMDDYEFFQNVIIKSAFDCPLYHTAMESLGYQLTKSSWFIKDKPNEDIVVDCFYKYLFYYYVVNAKRTSQEQADVATKLPLASVILPPNDDSLIRKKSIKINATKMVYEGQLRNNGLENGIWKSEHCESMNEDKNVKYGIRNRSRPEIWVCKKCTAHNDKLMDHCVACGGDNREAINRVREYCKKCGNSEIIRDGLCPDCLSRSTSWICQYRLCENKNYGDGAYCKHCGLAKGFVAAGGDVERYKDGRMDKIWICDKCDKINKDCSTLICLHCHVKRYLMKNVDSEKWVCKKCTAHNGKSMGCCIACGGNKEEPVNIGKEYCTKCRKHEIIRDGLCPDCLSRSTSWICQYRFCANKNYGDGAYCKHCGLAKGFIAAGEDVLVRCKDGNVDEIWICDKCDKINEDCFRSVCDWCHDDRSAGFEIVKSVDDCGQAVNDKHINGGKWQCLHCQCRNPSNFMTCAACSQARLQLWTCKKCTLENRISNKRCVGCDYERRLCEKCGNNEITDDQFCGDCAARSPKWECWYIYCQKINYGDDKYCAHCGLERYPNRIKGAPIWQRKANSIDYKWICDKCGKINHKNATNCNDVTCGASRIMLSNWCPNCGRGNPTKYFASNCGACKRPI